MSCSGLSSGAHWPVGLVVLAEHLDELLAHQGDALDLLVERRLANFDGRVEVTAHPFGRIPAAGRLGDPEPEHRLGAGCVVGRHVENLPVATAAVKWYQDICANGRCGDVRSVSLEWITLTIRSEVEEIAVQMLGMIMPGCARW